MRPSGSVASAPPAARSGLSQHLGASVHLALLPCVVLAFDTRRRAVSVGGLAASRPGERLLAAAPWRFLAP